MTDRIPGAPGRYQAMFTDGELAGKEFTVTLRRDDAPIAEGTPYNKANVLPDALASQLCPGMEDPAPKDAFAALQAGKADIGRRKSGSKITLRDAASAPVTGLRIFGHAAGDGCIGDKGDITVKFAGKNIADIYGFSAVGLNTPESTRSLTNGYGTTISTTEPGNTLTITQTQCPKPNNVSFENGYFVIGFYHKIKDGETITVSFDVEITNDLSGNDIFGFMVSGVQYQSAPIINGKVKATFQWKNYGDRQYLEVENHGKSMIISNIQIEYGNTATDYEPYREPQTITVPTPGGLEGDELVQDEIDFGKGVLIRRVFENSEIPLPAHVLEAYGKLRTYAPTTIITNDEDADMEVHYCTPKTAVPMVCSPNDRGKILAIDDNGAVSLQTMASYVEYVEKSDGWDTRIWSDGFLEMYKKDTEGATIGQNGLCVIEYVLPFPVQSGCTVQVTPCGNVYLADYAAESASLCITLAGQAGTPVSAVCISVIGRLQ